MKRLMLKNIPEHQLLHKIERNNIRNIYYEISTSQILLKCYGLWPYYGKNRWIQALYNIQTEAVILFLLTTANLPLLSALIKVWGNFTLIADNFVVTIPMLCSEFKLCVFWLKKRDIVQLFDDIVRNWSQVKTVNEQNIMLKYAKKSRIISFFALIVIFINISLYHVAFLFKILMRKENNITDIPGYILPIQTYYHYDMSVGYRYVLTRIHQAIFCFVGGFFYTTVDILFALCILHICGQLEIFLYNITNDCEMISGVKTKNDTLKPLIKRHHELIRFIETTENIFSIMLLMMVVLFSVIFSILCYHVISAFYDETELPVVQVNFYAGFMTFFIFLMFIYSWVGQNLIDQSEKISMALYSSNWQSYSRKKSRELLIVMHRTQKSLMVTVGNLVPLTLETFLRLIKTSAGYASFLIAMKD